MIPSDQNNSNSPAPATPLWDAREHARLAADIGRWILLVIPVSFVIGSACALFLWMLEWATVTRYQHPALLYGLPLAGVAIAALYHWLGKSAEAGNNLIIDEIHEPGGGVPLRMAPLVLAGTVVTHLFGGSAGREGTAVQMGGSLAAGACRLLRLRREDTRILLMAGIASGFGAVFGTPLAGAIFALEVLTLGRLRYDALIPCLLAALAADWTASHFWQSHHTHYHIATAAASQGLNLMLAIKVVLAALAFGLVSVMFSKLIHGMGLAFKRTIPWPLARPFIGGVLVILLTLALGTRDYLGLGVWTPDPAGVSILTAFEPDGAHPWSWFWKLIFTAVTLGAGFKGGEVTPLFFIGATLGHTLANLMGAPVDLFAGLGFVAVFAGATNTPLACTLMSIELFGAANVPYFALACFTAYAISGHHGIYPSQRVEKV